MKNILTYPYTATINSLDYLTDKLGLHPKHEMYGGDVKISQELKEESMSFEELVMTRGFPLEIHYVETEDGYNLKLYRIPGGKGEKNFRFKQKQAILIMHGIFDSSDGWVCNSEDNCVPFVLANLGYDIWLGNNRGNKHSKHHKTHKNDTFEFWNFSFHEMGLYDIPAFLNHITEINTYRSKVIYLAHSQGTTQLFAALTQNLDYFKSKIKLFVALGPVARVYNMSSKLLLLLNKLKVDTLLEKLNMWEVFCTDEKLSKINSWLLPKVPIICNLVSRLISDINSSGCNNSKTMPVYLSHQPGGSSLKAVSHFVQLIRRNTFSMYDYGQEGNHAIYHSSEPKEYDLSLIYDIPIALFAGKQDKLSTPTDVTWLAAQLGENVIFSKTYDNMAHTTFIMSKDMKWFEDVIEIIDMYN